jgi:hypothetical protein
LDGMARRTRLDHADKTGNQTVKPYPRASE